MIHEQTSSAIAPEFWRGKRVAVTGHTGFKGSWLALWLGTLQAEVYGYALAPPAENTFSALHPSVHSTLADVRDRERLHRWLHAVEPTIIFHLAAQPLVRAGYADPIGTCDTNIGGTLNVLEAARTLDQLRALIVVTSDKAYAPGDGVPLREDAPLGGADPYSASKACAELVTSAYAQAFPTRAVIATARAGNVIGGGDWAADRLIPDLVRAVRSGREVRLRNPHAVRPWQHVLEPLAGYLRLAQRAASGDLSMTGAWNFGPSRSSEISVAQLATRTLQTFGLVPQWQHEPAAYHELPELRINSDKAQALLDWHPRYTIDDALSITLEWYRTALAGGDVARLSHSQIAHYVGHTELVVS